MIKNDLISFIDEWYSWFGGGDEPPFTKLIRRMPSSGLSGVSPPLRWGMA